MAMYLLCILRKDESAPIIVKALLYRFAFHNFSCMYRFLCHKFCLLLSINGLLTCLRGPQGRLVPPIGSPSVNKVYLLTLLTCCVALFRLFAWRYFVFFRGVISSRCAALFRLVRWRYFVFSHGVISSFFVASFRYFVFLRGVIFLSLRHIFAFSYNY